MNDTKNANKGMPCKEALPHLEETRLFTILLHGAENKYRLVQDDLMFSVTKIKGEPIDIMKKLVEQFNNCVGTKMKLTGKC